VIYDKSCSNAYSTVIWALIIYAFFRTLPGVVRDIILKERLFQVIALFILIVGMVGTMKEGLPAGLVITIATTIIATPLILLSLFCGSIVVFIENYNKQAM